MLHDKAAGRILRSEDYYLEFSAQPTRSFNEPKAAVGLCAAGPSRRLIKPLFAVDETFSTFAKHPCFESISRGCVELLGKEIWGKDPGGEVSHRNN